MRSVRLEAQDTALSRRVHEFKSRTLYQIRSHSIVVSIEACHASGGSSILPGTAKYRISIHTESNSLHPTTSNELHKKFIRN